MDHRITFWNKAAERLYGWTAEEILGVKNIENVYPDPAIIKETLTGLLNEGEWNGRLQQRRKDGKINTFKAHTTLIPDDSGARDFFLSLLQKRIRGETSADRRRWIHLSSDSLTVLDSDNREFSRSAR